MIVRKSESRIPAGLQASDLGQAVSTADGRCTLVSFFTEPLVTGCENGYVLFVTDPALSVAARSYRWTFTEYGESLPPRPTDVGVIFHEVYWTGSLKIDVAVLDADNSELASLHLEQQVVGPCVELESRIGDAAERPGASVADPEVLRELVNQYSPYYQQVTPKSAESPDALRRFTFVTAMNGGIRRTRAERREHIEHLADALNDAAADFSQLAAIGVGVCDIRPIVLAMTGVAGGAPLVPWTEMPERSDQRASKDEDLRKQLDALPEATQIDLFNILRFPKSSITHCARILEALRDKYFPGADFESVLTRMSGIRAFSIMRHYTEGPLVRS